jgi:hypothetical protein
MNVNQQYYLPVSFTPITTPSSSPCRKQLWTPERDQAKSFDQVGLVFLNIFKHPSDIDIDTLAAKS